MPRHLRRVIVPLFLCVLVVSLSGQSQTPVPPPAARPLPADTAALQAARAIPDSAARLAAFEKFRADFPQSPNLATVDSQMLSMLVGTWPERTEAITQVFERIIGRIPDPTALTPQLVGPINLVVGKKLLLDRSEQLLSAAMAALDESKYVETQRETAKRLKQPEPSEQVLKTRFGTMRSQGVDSLARVASARGDAAKAEALFKEAVAASPMYGPTVISLVEIYTARKEFDKAEAVLQAAIKAVPPPTFAVRAVMALADLYEKKGDDVGLEALLRDALKSTPPPAGTFARLGKLEARRGNHAKALENFVAAAAQGGITAADDAAMRQAYRALHSGSEAGLDALVDEVYYEKFANPVKPQPYTPPPGRTTRLVLLEMFTGSGCGPCVSADLAFDAVMERYAGAVVPVAYHQNIPAPDPMVTTGSVTRRDYYRVAGVPTFNIDGALGRLGGGARANTEATYRAYIAKIDQALLAPALAELSVSASGDGDSIIATANVSKLPADAKDLRLHILLVERELRFSGENGVRFHPMTVRGSAGENGSGIPISATGKTDHTFSLAAIKADITKSLQAEMEKRRKAEQPGATPREYAADGRPYVAIDPAHLSVVAFIQQGAYQPPAPSGTPVPGFEPTVPDITAQTAAASSSAASSGAASSGAASTGAAPAAPARPAPTAPVANVLQSAIAEVVFPAATKGKGGE